MNIAVMVAQYILIGGLFYVQYQLIIKLIKFIKPDTYVKNKGVDEFTKQLQLFIEEMKIEKKKETLKPTAVDKFLSKV